MERLNPIWLRRASVCPSARFRLVRPGGPLCHRSGANDYIISDFVVEVDLPKGRGGETCVTRGKCISKCPWEIIRGLESKGPYWILGKYMPDLIDRDPCHYEALHMLAQQTGGTITEGVVLHNGWVPSDMDEYQAQVNMQRAGFRVGPFRYNERTAVPIATGWLSDMVEAFPATFAHLIIGEYPVPVPCRDFLASIVLAPDVHDGGVMLLISWNGSYFMHVEGRDIFGVSLFPRIGVAELLKAMSRPDGHGRAAAIRKSIVDAALTMISLDL